MFGWFKRKPVVEKCKHFKEAGADGLSNMQTILRFSEYSERVDPDLSYSIKQCNVCGIRAFGCFFNHCMSNVTSGKIDDFIGYKIGIEELLAEFKRKKYRVELIDIDNGDK